MSGAPPRVASGPLASEATPRPNSVRGPVDLLMLLRGLAAITVVIWHVEGYKGTLPPVLNVPGRTAVWLFFGISGYVIAHGFLHRKYELAWSGLRHFFVNRVLRIYPLFLFLSLLAFVTIWIKTGDAPLTVGDIPAQFFALQFNHSYLLSGVFWTLGIELHFYLLAPLLALPLLARSRMTGPALALLYALMVYGYWYAVAHYGWSADGRNIVANLPHFFIGMIACRLVASGSVPVPAWISLPLALTVVGLTSWLYHSHTRLFWSATGMLLVDIAILFFAVAHRRLAARPAPSGMVYRAFSWLGVLSYGIYAWHAYFPALAPQLLDELLLLLVVSTAAAYASYRLLERPAIRLKRYSTRAGFVDGRREPRTAIV